MYGRRSIARHLANREYDRLTPQQLAVEVQRRNIDATTARPGTSSIQLLLRDDQPQKRAAIAHNATVGIMRLPPGIRNTIYDLVIDDYDETLPTSIPAKPFQSCYCEPFFEPALMYTCNTIRREMIPIVYPTRVLVFLHSNQTFLGTKPRSNYSLGVGARALEKWMNWCGSERLNAAKSIYITYGPLEFTLEEDGYRAESLLYHLPRECLSGMLAPNVVHELEQVMGRRLFPATVVEEAEETDEDDTDEDGG